MFCMHVEGNGHLHQHGRFVTLHADSGVLYEARSQWELDLPASSRSLTRQFSRQMLPLSQVISARLS
jgi:hypothetical protein